MPAPLGSRVGGSTDSTETTRVATFRSCSSSFEYGWEHTTLASNHGATVVGALGQLERDSFHLAVIALASRSGIGAVRQGAGVPAGLVKLVAPVPDDTFVGALGRMMALGCALRSSEISPTWARSG